MNVLRMRLWIPTLSVLLGIALLGGATPTCRGQSIELEGKDTKWEKVGTIPKLTPFMIHASGMVDFGGLGNNDGATAGVTGNEFVKFLEDNWGTIEKGLLILGEAAETVFESASVDLKADSTYANKVWAWQTEMKKATVNYDEGGFWVAVMTVDRAPSSVSDTNLAASIALYYWYNQLYTKNIAIEYQKEVYVYVRSHDGGHNPFKQSGDWGDNSGTYSIWLNTIDMPMEALVADAKADRANRRGPLQMSKSWTHPVPLESRVVYKLQNVQASKFLGGEPMAAGAKVSLSPDQGGDGQRWQPTRRGDGSYVFQNLGTHGDLEGTASGVRQLPSEHVTLEGWKPIGNLDGTYSFMNPQSHKFLTADAAGNLTLSPPDGTPAQKWKLSNANK